MAVITPTTDVYLLKVPLEINDLNQLTFSNATAQYNYFNSLPKLEVHDFTYQRKDSTIRFGAEFDDLLNYNYVMYRNDAFSNKWFYAFVTNLEWKSPNCTDITIKTDVWQTYQFDITFKPVLVDREHVNDDTIGKNTLPEGLELGEMVVNGSTLNFGGVGGTGLSDYCCVVEVSQVENTGESATLSYSWASGTHSLTPRLGSIYRGTIPLVLGMIENVANTPSAITEIYDFAGLGDAIVNIYMLPNYLVPFYNQITITATKGAETKSFTGAVVPDDRTGVIDLGRATFTRPTTLNGYQPKNGKMYTYPFCYFNLSNNAGSCIPYHYEDFSNQNNNAIFLTEGVFGAGGSVKTMPINYKNVDYEHNSLDYSINAPKYPICSWKSDSYTNWLTQNAVNLDVTWRRELLGAAVDIGGGAVRGGMNGASLGGPTGAVGGAIVGAGMGMFTGGVSLINLAREQHLAKTQANMVADTARGNLGAGDFVWAKYRSPFTYIPMSIKAEYARCADEFLSQFGYKCNRVKVPNITGRRNWNYVKTVGCYIEGDIPQTDMQEIKDMFDRGITLWHNPATFADYSQNNDIIS